jgi:hypothetical protein
MNSNVFGVNFAKRDALPAVGGQYDQESELWSNGEDVLAANTVMSRWDTSGGQDTITDWDFC